MSFDKSNTGNNVVKELVTFYLGAVNSCNLYETDSSAIKLPGNKKRRTTFSAMGMGLPVILIINAHPSFGFAVRKRVLQVENDLDQRFGSCPRQMLKKNHF